MSYSISAVVRGTGAGHSGIIRLRRPERAAPQAVWPALLHQAWHPGPSNPQPLACVPQRASTSAVLAAWLSEGHPRNSAWPGRPRQRAVKPETHLAIWSSRKQSRSMAPQLSAMAASS